MFSLLSFLSDNAVPFIHIDYDHRFRSFALGFLDLDMEENHCILFEDHGLYYFSDEYFFLSVGSNFFLFNKDELYLNYKKDVFVSVSIKRFGKFDFCDKKILNLFENFFSLYQNKSDLVLKMSYISIFGE